MVTGRAGSADFGQRQFYRILDTALAAGERFETTTERWRRGSFPPGAIVIAFSTMLDTEFALALIDSTQTRSRRDRRRRAEGSPFEGEQDPMIERMWALQRSAMYRDMATTGVDVLAWRADRSLRSVDARGTRPAP